MATRPLGDAYHLPRHPYESWCIGDVPRVHHSKEKRLRAKLTAEPLPRGRRTYLQRVAPASVIGRSHAVLLRKTSTTTQGKPLIPAARKPRARASCCALRRTAGRHFARLACLLIIVSISSPSQADNGRQWKGMACQPRTPPINPPDGRGECSACID